MPGFCLGGLGEGEGEGKNASSAFRVIRLLILCILCVGSGVANNVTFVLMASAVPSPSFILYATTIVYTLLYFIWYLIRLWNGAYAQGAYSGPKSSMLYLYGASVALIVVNGVFSQYADPHVDGVIQSVANQLTLPLTALLSTLILKHPLTRVEMLGAFIVLAGSLLPIIPTLINPPSSGQNTPFWISMFIISDIPSAFINIAEEAILDEEGMAADPIHYLMWTNLGTIPFYVLCIFVDMIPGFGPGGDLPSVLHKQKEAWECFLGSTSPLPPGCRPHAWIYIMAFCLAYLAYFYLLAVVTKHESAAFQSLVSASVVPASAIAFSFSWLVGSSVATPLNDYVLIGVVGIIIGMCVYKFDDFVFADRKAPVPLIARH